MFYSTIFGAAVVLISLLVLLVYVLEVDIAELSSNVRIAPWILQEYSKDEVTLPPDENTYYIPQQDWYNTMITAGVGKKNRTTVIQLVKGGPKMNITVLAAYEYPEQINVLMTSRDKYGDVVYCRYFDKFKKEIGVPFKSVVFPEFNVHCLRRSDAAFMSLTDTPEGDFEFPVPLIDRTQPAPIYGNESKWLLLAELIEHYKLQGATHFYVYSKYIDEYSRILLDDYVRTGDVEVVILHDHFTRNDDRWQSVELQDCLVRGRRHSRWLAFIDLDERLTLTDIGGTIRDYLQNITDPTVGGIQFRQRWILKNEFCPERYVDDAQVSLWMPTRRYHNTSHVGPVGHTTKCIIDPEKVLIMNVHYVTKFLDGYRMYRMLPEEGVVRHYRDVNSGAWGKKWLKSVAKMGNFSLTDYPKEFAPKLLANVRRRLHHVYVIRKNK